MHFGFESTYYDELKYKPFTYSPDGRYIAINDTALSIYDTPSNSMLELVADDFIVKRSEWVEAGNSLLYFTDDNSYEPVTYKRFFVNPVVVSPSGSVITDIDQMLGGDDGAVRAVNPVILGDGNIFFERCTSAQRPLAVVGLDGQSLAVLSDESSVEITGYEFSSNSNTVIYSEGCSLLTQCSQSGLYSVDADGGNRIKLNPDVFPLTGVKSFSIQP